MPQCILNWPNLYLQGYLSKAYVNIAHTLMETKVYAKNIAWTRFCHSMILLSLVSQYNEIRYDKIEWVVDAVHHHT